MSNLFYIKLLAIILTALVLIGFWVYGRKLAEPLTRANKIKTALTGFVANLGDTLGIGSFASIIAMSKAFKIMPDEVNLVGAMNLQAMVTALFQALIFLHFVDVDITTLVVSIVMITLGGFVSGFIVVNVSRTFVRRVMFYAFIITGAILFLSQVGVFAINGVGNGLSGYKLIIFGILMFITGLLPAFGIGYYALVQIFIFIMGVSPIIAFPIMTTASAFQMPATSVPFVMNKKFYFKSTILLMVFGVLGVFVAAPLVAITDSYYLKWILLVVIVYNILMLRKKQ